MIFGAIAANAFADNSFKNIADDPFKNIGEIDDHGPPAGFVDKLKIIPYSIKVIPMEWAKYTTIHLNPTFLQHLKLLYLVTF